jgi:site-specific DNA recombinase
VGVRLEVEPNQASTVGRIFELYAAGDSLKTIAKRLNADGVRSPSPYRGQSHPSWAPAALSILLRNERYTGTVIWNRTRKIRDPKSGRRIQRLRPRSEWKVSQAPRLRIISDELWQSVQNRRRTIAEYSGSGKKNGLCSRSFSARYLLSGFLKCGLCGSNLVMVSGRGQADWGKYGCPLHHLRGICDNPLLLQRAKLEREILAGLENSVLREEIVSYAIEEFGRQLRAKLRTAKQGIGALRLRRDKLKGEIANLSRAIAEAGHSSGLLAELSARERELESIGDEIFSAEGDGIEARLEEIETFARRRLRDIRSLLMADVPRAKAELAKHCTTITVTPEGKTYKISGDWDLLGGRSVGAEGQNRTAYAGLFRAALYR